MFSAPAISHHFELCNCFLWGGWTKKYILFKVLNELIYLLIIRGTFGRLENVFQLENSDLIMPKIGKRYGGKTI